MNDASSAVSSPLETEHGDADVNDGRRSGSGPFAGVRSGDRPGGAQRQPLSEQRPTESEGTEVSSSVGDLSGSPIVGTSIRRPCSLWWGRAVPRNRHPHRDPACSVILAAVAS